MTIKQALLWADRKLKETEDSKKSAYFLLKNVILKDESLILAYPEFLLTKRQELKFKQWILKRKKNLPVCYIVGFIDFYGLRFKVNKDVLIPRPETEVLVEMILSSVITAQAGIQKIKHLGSDLVISDIGTGSGAIGLSLAKNLPEAKIYLVDISSKALKVAKKNSKINNIQNVIFKKGNLLEPLSEKADIVVANLPYSPTEDLKGLPLDITCHEPRLALDGGEDGMDVYRQFFNQVKNKLKTCGKIYLEIGENQGEKVKDLSLGVFPNANVLLKKDWAGLDRYVIVDL